MLLIPKAFEALDLDIALKIKFNVNGFNIIRTRILDLVSSADCKHEENIRNLTAEIELQKKINIKLNKNWNVL